MKFICELYWVLFLGYTDDVTFICMPTLVSLAPTFQLLQGLAEGFWLLPSSTEWISLYIMLSSTNKRKVL